MPSTSVFDKIIESGEISSHRLDQNGLPTIKADDIGTIDRILSNLREGRRGTSKDCERESNPPPAVQVGGIGTQATAHSRLLLRSIL
jgi:hypothetical protein